MEQYTEKLIEHFRNPRNMGDIAKPSASAQVGNPVCGDVMKIDILVEGKKIKDIKFKTLGCAAAIATSSILTEIAKGKTLAEAKKIGNADIAKELGGMPKVKLHCSVLAADCLRQAIKNYELAITN
ncbi:MAG: iron-sulfur cluster assembly scaffold protein [bacterium]